MSDSSTSDSTNAAFIKGVFAGVGAIAAAVSIYVFVAGQPAMLAGRPNADIRGAVAAATDTEPGAMSTAAASPASSAKQVEESNITPELRSAIEELSSHCVWVLAPDSAKRTLTLYGKNLNHPFHSLQFRPVSNLEEMGSIFYHLEVQWNAPTQIAVDISRLRLSWQGPTQVRIINDIGRGSARYAAVSDWSAVFTIANDPATCKS